MKEVLAAPDSFLPSEPTALVSQVSSLHFFRNEVLAAPDSALPSLPTALVAQVSCAIAAEPRAKVATIAATNIRFMGDSPWNKPFSALDIGITGPLEPSTPRTRLSYPFAHER